MNKLVKSLLENVGLVLFCRFMDFASGLVYKPAKKNSTNNSTIPTRGRSITYIPFDFPHESKSVNFCTQATNDKPAGTSRQVWITEKFTSSRLENVKSTYRYGPNQTSPVRTFCIVLVFFQIQTSDKSSRSSVPLKDICSLLYNHYINYTLHIISLHGKI